MMREFLRIFMLPLTILLAVSCNRTLEPDSSFIGSSAIELISSGQVIYTYDPATWQLGYNPSTKEFR